MATVEYRVPSRRIAVLDGWRGIALLLVLLEHVVTSITGSYPFSWTQTGQHGVTLFFVLSGFLITARLKEGNLDLKKFYIRRFFRLMPVAWAYLATVEVVGLLLGHSWISLHELAACVFFFRNYIGGQATVYAGHFWSLSMEEQFYLVWPLLLLLAGSRRAAWIATAGAFACAFFRLENWTHYNRLWESFHTEVRADALFTGCVLALILSGRSREPILRFAGRATLPALALLLYCFYAFHWLPPLMESVAFALLIAATLSSPVSRLRKVLESRVLVWVGSVSYSVYVWQQVFIMPRWHGAARILMYGLMPIFALASYYLIEKPCTRLGQKLTPSETPSPRNIADSRGLLTSLAEI